MKHLLSILFAMIIWQTQAQTHITVHGKHIIGPCGDTLHFKGVNYAPFNWGFEPGDNKINEIASSNANALRIVWYANHPTAAAHANYNNMALLDTVLAQSTRHGMIPILELHDLTCSNDSAALINLADWFTQPAVKSVLNKYAHSLVIKIANEALHVAWTGGTTASKSRFINTYKKIIDKLRTTGYTIPLMIDAPDCGMTIDAIVEMGPTLTAADPQRNIIYSAHAYWTAYSAMDSAVIRTKLLNAASATVPIVLGEIANWQDDGTPCMYELHYKPLLKMCQELMIGWIAWLWDRDICPERQLTTDGLFAHPTSYGSDIFFHPNYGIQSKPYPKSKYLTTGSCDIGTRDIGIFGGLEIYPNPTTHTLHIQHLNHKENIKYIINNTLGTQMMNGTLNSTRTIDVQILPAGIYILLLDSEGDIWQSKFSVVN